MPEQEAPAWWAGVEHLREGYERGDGARRDREDLAARRAARERASHHRDAGTHRPAPAPQPPARASQLPPPRPAPARRTVVIRGQTVPAPTMPRIVDVERRRPPRRPVERVGPRPDRIAMWALLMGILLILVAVGTADGAVAAAFAP